MADPSPFDYIQPDGTKITLRLRGDEFFHWEETVEGFTVMRVGDKFVYAKLDEQDRLIATTWQVGQTEPRVVGLKPGLLPLAEARPANMNAGLVPYRPWTAKATGGIRPKIGAIGTVRNLVILCKFQDHAFGVHTRAQGDYDVLFNQIGGDPVLAPTGSVKDAYLENSYGIVTLESTVFAWVTLPQNQAYYAGTNNGLGADYPNNAQKMVEDALTAADPLINFAYFDEDLDGYVDAIDIVHSGYGAEKGGAPPNSIWSHKSGLPTDWVSAESNSRGVKVKVNTYHTEPALYGTSGTNILRIGVVCHETGHFFGLPDLYDTDNSSDGIGSWCMMANSWGFDGTQLRPPHFSAWCKVFLGWTAPTILNASGTYSVAQSETAPSVYRIDRGFDSGEYLLIENRQPVGLDSKIPQGGLAIWHIDENVANNKSEGFPGQPGWPGNGNHYKVALLQADGNYDLERIAHGNAAARGDGGDLYHAGGQNFIGLNTSPGTDAYKSGDLRPTGNRLSQISSANATMSFVYSTPSRLIFANQNYNGFLTIGSWSFPYKRVTDAYNAAQNGDEIVVVGGDYHESPLKMNQNKQVTLDSYQGAASVR